MDQIRARKAIEKLAEAEGVPAEKIVADINSSIAVTYKHYLEKGDPEQIASWRNIPRENEIPTAYELIDSIAEYIDDILLISYYLSLPDDCDEEEDNI